MRNKYIIWYVALLMLLVGLFIDIAKGSTDSWIPVSFFSGIFSIVLVIVGIIYYLLRKQTIRSGFLLITVDLCVCYTILYSTLIMLYMVVHILFPYPALRRLLKKLITFPTEIGFGLYLFGLVQIIALVILIATLMRSD